MRSFKKTSKKHQKMVTKLLVKNNYIQAILVKKVVTKFNLNER